MSAALVLPPQLGSWVQVGTTNAVPHAAPPAQYFAPAQQNLSYQSGQQQPQPPAANYQFQQQAPVNYAVGAAYGQPAQQQQQQQQQQVQQQHSSTQIVTQQQLQQRQLAQGALDVTEAQIRAKYKKFVAVSLKEPGPCSPSLQACGLTKEQYQTVAQRVASVKKSHNQSKVTWIFLFGLAGYFIFRNQKPLLRDELKPILEKYNKMLGGQGVAVRYLWVGGELLAFHL